jgi:hypothetical protein
MLRLPLCLPLCRPVHFETVTPLLPPPLQTLSNQDISQFLIISVLAGLFWLQTGKDNAILG